jgi:hypothetical protein
MHSFSYSLWVPVPLCLYGTTTASKYCTVIWTYSHGINQLTFNGALVSDLCILKELDTVFLFIFCCVKAEDEASLKIIFILKI